jgi:pimeloyl-ACP methyl ester carboxylesterase
MTGAAHLSDLDAGPAVLFVHGQPGAGSDFDAVARLLARDHRLLLPDRAGYGKSGEEPASMRDNADALAALVEEQGASPSVVVGHSYGGGVSILLATEHPEAVAALVLVASVGLAGNVRAFDRLLAAPVLGDALSAVSVFALSHVLPRLRRAARVLPGHAAARLQVTLPDEAYVEAVSRPGDEARTRRAFLYEQRTLLEEIGAVEGALGRIAVPTVVVAGAWDVVVPLSVARRIAAMIPGARLVVLEQVGHFVLRDAPEAVADAVRFAERRASGREEVS